MAATCMARKATIEKEVDDMTECSICTELFTDPRVLPCIHTFCLKCLMNYGKDRQPGDDMPCPLCRKEFTIPDDGFSGIQKNFFMEKLLHTRKLSAGEDGQRAPCDACSGNEAGDGKPASVYCVQCQENYCEQCSQVHGRMKASADHVQMEVGKQLQKQEIILSQPATCDIHKGKEIEVFCLECKSEICMMCFIKSHKAHNCSDIAEVAVDLRRRMKGDTDKASDLLMKTENVLPRFDKEKSDLIKRLSDIKSEINAGADSLIAAVELDRAQLLSEVESIRQKRVKQLETVKHEVEHHMAALESLKRYSETLLSSGTDCDVTRSANSLHDRAEELAMCDVIGHVDNCLPPINVNFTSSTGLNIDPGNLVGTITEEDETPSTPTVTHVITGGNKVASVTSFDNEVFVARESSEEIEVYDDVTFTLQRRLAVPGLGLLPFGLAACARNKCLYASDWYNSSVHRIELSGSKAVKKWSVARCPAGVTVNNAGNLIVVSRGEHKLQEFTTRGTLVRNIQLQSDIDCPWHSLQLASGQFLVSNHGSLHRVCLVDNKGSVVRSYGGQAGSDLTKMRNPGGLAVDKDGRVLVADKLNNRLLVIDGSLTNAHVMSVSVDGDLNQPHSVWYDKSRGRLYIGEWSGSRVTVIDHLKDFTASQV